MNETAAVQALALELAHEALEVMNDVKRSGLKTRQKSDAADPVTLSDTRIEALALAQVAAGQAELFISGRLQPYDKAGGLMLIGEAGGDPGAGALEAAPVLAGAPALARAAIEALRAL
ncbi:hypothetical protein BH24DEI1_BH24DEI1_18870 [soil metagenome]|jgi:fructose-1,6-bisphosphatase/inositol monophosphatase family enzyme|nr:hypothetical protein [Deinococcota bacterium]